MSDLRDLLEIPVDMVQGLSLDQMSRQFDQHLQRQRAVTDLTLAWADGQMDRGDFSAYEDLLNDQGIDPIEHTQQILEALGRA